MAGKVTVCLASHWPSITDFVVYPFGLSIYGLNGLGNGDEHPPTLQEGHGTLYLFM